MWNFSRMRTACVPHEETCGNFEAKFDIVLDRLNKELNGLGIADWFSPKGGYFISWMCCPAPPSEWASCVRPAA